MCVPPTWTVTSDATNIIQLQRGEDPQNNLALAGEFRLDHADAVTRISQSIACNSADFMVDFPALDGWPAMHTQTTFDVPACGECTEPGPTEAYAVSTYVAAELFVLMIFGQTAVPVDPTIVDELRAIGRTVTVTGISAPVAAATATELIQLEDAKDAMCGP